MNQRDEQRRQWAAIAVKLLVANRSVDENTIATALWGPPPSKFVRWSRVSRLMQDFGFYRSGNWMEFYADDDRRKFHDFAGALGPLELRPPRRICRDVTK